MVSKHNNSNSVSDSSLLSIQGKAVNVILYKRAKHFIFITSKGMLIEQ